MDKIQSAIAKARATREGTAKTSVAKGRKPRGAASEEIWQGIPSCELSPKKMARNRIVTYDRNQVPTSGSTAFDLLRTKILLKMQSNGWKRLAVTSPTAGNGKSTVVMNLAFSLSKQPNLHTIVADMDMRLPQLAKAMGVTGHHGFASVLAGQKEFAEVAIRPRPNLAFGVNYSPSRNPAELFQGPATAPALAAIEETYNPALMIFDMPPMLANDDTIAFMGQVDCVLLIAAAETTTLREIDVCERELASHTNVLGVVMNKCRYTEQSAGYETYG